MEARRILLIGDSISIQYSRYLRSMLGSRTTLIQKDGVELALRDLDVPTGANGGDSGMVYRYLVQAIIEMECELALVNCGLHDIKRTVEDGPNQIPIDRYAENVDGICELFDEAGIPMVWINTTPVIDRIHRERQSGFFRHNADVIVYNRCAESIMTTREIPVIDLNQLTRSLGDEQMYCDHVHFVDWVRQAQAACVAGWIAGRLSNRQSFE